MAINDTRLPGVMVTFNGSPVAGIVDVEISSNSFMGADRYRLTAALAASGYEIWASTRIDLQISIGLDGNWQSLITGPVDRVDIDLGNGLVHVDGRDLTARFIESRLQETFENQTSSEIATTLALRRGLQAHVTSTTSLVGRSFGGDHAQTTLDQYSGTTTEWDLLAALADLEGFDVWTQGTILNFAPPEASLTPFLVTPQDCSAIRLERIPALCSDLQVSVKSWDCRAQEAISQTAGSSAMGNYVVIRPNLTSAAALDLANRTLSQMTQHARVVSIELPGELVASPRQTLTLMGTETDFDGTYVITSVERRLSIANGFTETLQARVPPWTAS